MKMIFLDPSVLSLDLNRHHLFSFKEVGVLAWPINLKLHLIAKYTHQTHFLPVPLWNVVSNFLAQCPERQQQIRGGLIIPPIR